MFDLEFIVCLQFFYCAGSLSVLNRRGVMTCEITVGIKSFKLHLEMD